MAKRGRPPKNKEQNTASTKSKTNGPKKKEEYVRFESPQSILEESSSKLTPQQEKIALEQPLYVEVDGVKKRVIYPEFYFELQDLINENEELYDPSILDYRASNGELVNLRLFPNKIEEAMVGCPEDEIERVKRIKWDRIALMNKVNTLQKRAANMPYRNAKKKQISFLEENKDRVLEFFGSRHSIEETLKWIKEEWEVDEITYEELSEFFDFYKEQIVLLRDEFDKENSGTRLTFKSSRIHELSFLYDQLKREFTTTKNIAASKSMQSVLSQIKKEVEDDSTVGINLEDLQTEAEIMSHLQDNIYKTIAIREIIIGRVAAKAGVDTAKVIADMHKSYYSKYTKMLHGPEAPQDIEGPYPSQVEFNMDVLEESKENTSFTELEQKAIENVKEDNGYLVKPKSDNVREKLLKVFKERQESINSKTAKARIGEK